MKLGTFLLLAHAAWTVPAALAANPVTGYQLYNNTPGGNGTSCASSSCHGPDPTQNNNNVLLGANNPTIIQNAINSGKGGMNIYIGTLTSSNIADIAAYLGNPAAGSGPNAVVSPTSLSFPSTAVGSTSTAQTVTLSNTGASTLTISSIGISGAGFAVTGGSCASGGSVAVNASCTIMVAFKPTASGTLSGTLNIADNAANSPSSVSLTGTATAAQPTLVLSTAALSFAGQNVGSSSAAQNVTVRNSGSAALNFTGITIGGADAADFAAAGTCAVGTAVAAGGSCSLSVTFTPKAAGTRSATLSLASNASNGTQSVSLAGTGIAVQPVASVSPVSLAFGSVVVGQKSAAQTVTLGNTGNAPLQPSSITVGSSDFAISGGTCAVGTPVAVGGTCTVLLVFQPQASGARSATLSIASNAGSSPATVALSGTGTAATPVAQLAPATLTFSQVIGSTSTAQTLTLSNTGTAPLQISAVSLGGTAPADYTIAPGSTCAAGGSVAAGASCLISIVFTPSAAGARDATLSVSHNAAGSPSTANLNGTGTSAPVGQVSVNAVSLSFAAQSVNTTSAPKSLSVSNSGSAPLSFNGLAIGGANASDFALAGTTTCAAGGTLQPAGNCIVAVTFTPTVSSGTRSATLTITSNAGNPGVVISLGGTAAPPAAPLVSLTPASLNLGSVTIGGSSAPQTATLANTGSAALQISGLAASPAPFALTHDCPASLASGATCTLSVTFTPAASGALSGSVTLGSNAATSPNTLALTGTGVAAPAPQLVWSSATSMSFPDTPVGSAAAAQSINLSNLGNAAASIQQIQIAGADAADFALASSGTCPAAGTLAAGATCAIAAVFTPAAAGARSASLAVVSNAAAPPPAPLSGNGISTGVPALALSPTALYLSGPANAPLQPQALVLTNSGAGVLDVTSIQAAAPLQVLNAGAPGGGTCPPPPFSLQPAASCTLMVGASAAISNAQLQISSNASTTPATVPVSGTPATNAGAGGCSIAPPGQPADPLWALMLLAAAAVLWRRRAGAPVRSKHPRKPRSRS